MNWPRTIAHEVFGLFVDDRKFAVAVLIWLVILKLLGTHLNHAARWSGFILFGGLAAILVESALRSCRQSVRWSAIIEEKEAGASF